jgi:hypothetical protein
MGMGFREETQDGLCGARLPALKLEFLLCSRIIK